MSSWVQRMVLMVTLLHATQSKSIDSVNSHPNRQLQNRDRNSREENGVLVRETTLRFYLRPPNSMVMTTTQNEVLECQAGGTPPPRLHWLKDGRRLTQGTDDDYMDSTLEDDTEPREENKTKLGISSTNTRLYLDCVTPEDSGQYTCVAENPYHRTSTHTELTVLPPTHHINGGCTSRSSLDKPPRIHLWSKKMLEFIDGEVRLLCRSDGVPRPRTEWLGIQEESLPNDTDKYQILPSGDLVIRQLEWNDMGNYVCIAKNIHGTDRTETFVYPTTRGN